MLLWCSNRPQSEKMMMSFFFFLSLRWQPTNWGPVWYSEPPWVILCWAAFLYLHNIMLINAVPLVVASALFVHHVMLWNKVCNFHAWKNVCMLYLIYYSRFGKYGMEKSKRNVIFSLLSKLAVSSLCFICNHNVTEVGLVTVGWQDWSYVTQKRNQDRCE